MRKTDRATNLTKGQLKDRTVGSTTLSAFKVAGRILLTIFAILLITAVIVGISLLTFIYSMKDESVKIDLKEYKQTYTSYLYVNGSGDNKNQPVQKLSLHSGEQRIWVNYAKIPQAMKDAIVSIEDKRFWDHKGVDWGRTMHAVFNLAGGADNFGGSTITQQLIKNLTQENEVSLTRKVKESFRAHLAQAHRECRLRQICILGKTFRIVILLNVRQLRGSHRILQSIHRWSIKIITVNASRLFWLLCMTRSELQMLNMHRP